MPGAGAKTFIEGMNNMNVVYFAPSLMGAVIRIGELYDAQGNAPKAIEYYTKLIDLWRDADAELQPYVRHAQQRVQALTASTRR